MFTFFGGYGEGVASGLFDATDLTFHALSFEAEAVKFVRDKL